MYWNNEETRENDILRFLIVYDLIDFKITGQTLYKAIFGVHRNRPPYK